MAEEDHEHRTQHKALEINLDPLFYGSIAEIGAGQEVARQFFLAGGASGTVAKAMSAYDMKFSDAIYGQDESGRYVTRSRLEAMLDTEYDQVIRRLQGVRPDGTRYFAFADTVEAKQYGSERDGHGWMGVRFQHRPGCDPSTVVLHVRMLDSSNKGQQEALGILGVNLIHAAYHLGEDPQEMVDSLMDNLRWGRIQVDFIHFDGTCFEEVDNRAMNLRLVTSSLGPVVVFGPDGHAVLTADVIHHKDVLILRGTFRPFRDVHEDMIRAGLDAFADEHSASTEEIVHFCEVNVARYLSDGVDEVSDLDERVAYITGRGHHVMVTSHLRYFRLGEYFTKNDRRKVGFLLSVDNLRTIFDEGYYEGLEGGILEAMGKLFASDSMLLAYPILTRQDEVITAQTFQVNEKLQYLYQHLMHNGRIIPLKRDRDTLVPFGS